MKRLLRRLFVAAIVIGAFVLVAGHGVWTLATAAADLRDAEDLIDSASLALEDGRLADARSDLARAEDLVIGANDSIHGAPALDILGSIPIARDNLVALTDSIELSAAVIHGGVRILDSSAGLQGPEGTLEVSLAEGQVPLDAVTQAQKEIAALSESSWSSSGRRNPPGSCCRSSRKRAPTSTKRRSRVVDSSRCSTTASSSCAPCRVATAPVAT